jgi:alkylation response protein AidB-like acyl-CoA dehydrogenase
MSIVNLKPAVSRPSIDELIARAKDIGRLARDCAEQTERERTVPAALVAKMKEAGLFRILQPRIYGGYEYDFDVMVPVVAAVAAGCGSAGWVFSLGIVHQWLAAQFPKQAQDEVWADQDAIAAGSYPPVGKAVPVSGGYRLSGVWSFTSGCDHMQWLFFGGMIPPKSEGAPPTPAFFLVRQSEVRFEDNWYTMGLAGTGSKNTIIEDLFVPEHRVVPFLDLLVGKTPGAALHDNPLYRQAMLSALPFTLVSPVLGMAEGALADFTDMAKVRATRGAVAGGNNRMAEFATIQTRVAEATGSIQSARLLILDSLAKALAAAREGRQTEMDIRLNNRLAQAFSVRLLVQAVDALFLASGGQGIFTSKPLQRTWRDAHAAAVHVSMNWDAVSTMYGQYALGLEPKGQY